MNKRKNIKSNSEVRYPLLMKEEIMVLTKTNLGLLGPICEPICDPLMVDLGGRI